MVYPNLIAEMARVGVTKEAMAEGLGIHVSGVYKMLRGERRIPITAAFEIRDKFFPGENIEYLFSPAERVG